MNTTYRVCLMSVLLMAPVLFAADSEKASINQSDSSITQAIRKAIAADKSLSAEAHNIKISTYGGWVNLKGPVRTREERLIIEDKAIEVAGRYNVFSQLELAPANQGITEDPFIETTVPVKSDDPKRTR